MWDIGRTNNADARSFYRPAPGRIRSIAAFSQDSHYDELDRDCEGRCIRDVRTPSVPMADCQSTIRREQ